MLLICLLLIGPRREASSQLPYFQQEVNTTIHVTLNDKSNELDAFETVEYINNSPDTLKFLYFHLWPNGYADNHTPLAKQLWSLKGKERLFNDPELKGFIDSLNFKVNNQQVQWNPHSGREVTTWDMFTNKQAGLWKDALQYANHAIWCFLKWNGDYPYQSYTAVQSALSAGGHGIPGPHGDWFDGGCLLPR